MQNFISMISVSYTHLTLPTITGRRSDTSDRRTLQKKKKKNENKEERQLN